MNESAEKKKGRFNFFDALLILLVVAVAAVGIWYFFFRSSSAAATAPAAGSTVLNYTVVFRNVPDSYNVKLQQGDELFLITTKELLGTVEGVSIRPAPYTGFNDITNEYVQSTYTGYRDVFVTIRSTVNKTASDYTVGDASIAVGSKIGLRTKLFYGESYVYSIEEVPAE